jgi:hypothetical protein
MNDKCPVVSCAYLFRRADQRADLGIVLGARRSPKVQEVDIRNGHVGLVILVSKEPIGHSHNHQLSSAYRKQLAESLVGLAITLVHLNRPVVVLVVVLLVGDVLDVASAAAAAECGRLVRVDAWPDLDAGAVTGVGHAVVEDVDVLNNVVLLHVLTQRADRDAVAAVASQALHHNVGTVGLEGNAVVAVVDDRVLNHDAVGSIRVPAICVLGCGA